MTTLLRSFSRWFNPKPRTIRRSISGESLFVKPRLQFLEERVAPAVTITSFIGSGTQDELNLDGLDISNPNGIPTSVPVNGEGTIGPKDFVENLNGMFVVYSRTGNTIDTANPVARISGNQFFDPKNTFNIENDTLHPVYDTRVVFDPTSGRWFALALMRLNPTNGGATGNEAILAVSNTSDANPAAGWHQYELTLGVGTGITDYPTLAVDANGVYIGYSIISATDGTYIQGKAAAIPISAVLTGTGSQILDSNLINIDENLGMGAQSLMFSSPQAVENYGPASNTAWFISSSPSNDTDLKYLTFTWGATPTWSTVGTINGGAYPVADPSAVNPTMVGTIAVGGAPAYGTAAGLGGPNDKSNDVETGDRRLLNAVIQNGQLYTTRTVAVNQTGTATTPDRDGAQWFQVNLSTLAIADEGLVYDSTVTATPMFYYYPSIAVNGRGDIFMGFSGSSASIARRGDGSHVGEIGAYATQRLVSENLAFGKTDAIQLVAEGTGTFNLTDPSNPTSPRKRWGDYSFTTIDPVDDLTAWTVQEFAANGSALTVPDKNARGGQENYPLPGAFGSVIGRFSTPAPTLNSTGNPLEKTGNQVTLTLTGTGLFDFNDPYDNATPSSPAFTDHLTAAIVDPNGGATAVAAQFNPANGSVTLTFNVSGTAVTGAYTVTLTNPDGHYPGGQSATLPNAFHVAANSSPVVMVGRTLNYTQQGTPILIAGDATLTDSDNATLAGVAVAISSGFQNDQNGLDVLGFSLPNGSLIQGNYNINTGVLSFTNISAASPAPVSAYLAALQTVTFAIYTDSSEKTLSADPSASPRTITFIASDGEAVNSIGQTTRSVTVTTVNDAPLITNLETTALSYTIGQSAINVTQSAVIVDPDPPASPVPPFAIGVTGATVTISSGYDKGNDLLSYTPVNGSPVTGNFDSTTGTLTLKSNGSAHIADFQLALHQVAFSDSGSSSSTARVLTFTADDGRETLPNHMSTGTYQRTVDVTVPTPTATAISGTIWTDAAGGNDVTKASSDPGVAGAVVELHNSADNSLIAQVVTGADGSYNFPSGTAAAGKSVYVVVRTPADMAVAAVNASSTNTIGSDFDPTTGKSANYIVGLGGVQSFNADLDAGPAFGFAFQAGGSNSDIGNAVATIASNGNVIVVGKIHGTVDMDSGPATYNLSANGDNAFVAEYTSVGALLWARAFVSTAAGVNQAANGVAVDNTGDVYVTGVFSGTVNFGGGNTMTSVGAANAFVVKLDKNGNWVYDFQQGSGGTETGQAIAVDGSGLAYVTGTTAGNNAFVTRLTATGVADTSFNATGEIVTSGGTAQGRGIAVDSSGNVYITGSYTGANVDFDSGATKVSSAGSTDAFVWRLNSNGTFGFIKSYGSTGADSGNAIAVDASGDLYVAGAFTGTVDFGFRPSLTSAGQTDGFVLILSSAGSNPAAIQVGGALADSANGIALGANNLVAVTGTFEGTATFTGTHQLTGSTTKDSAFVLRLNTSLAYTVVQGFGPIDSNLLDASALGIATNSSGDIYTTGSFEGTTNFDPTGSSYSLTSAGGTDLFLSRINVAPVVTINLPPNVAENQPLDLVANAISPLNLSLNYAWMVNGQSAGTSSTDTLSWANLLSFGVTPYSLVPYTVSLTVTDSQGNATTVNAKFTTSDPPVTINLSASSVSVGAGAPFSLSVSGITDAGSSDPAANVASYTIDWGDGTAQYPDTTTGTGPLPSTIDKPVVDYSSTGGPTYNPYYAEIFSFHTVTISLTEKDGHTDVDAGQQGVSVGVDNPTLQLDPTAPAPINAASVNQGTPYTIKFDNITGVGNKLEIEGVIVNWGDGSSSVVYGDPSHQEATHIYTAYNAAGYNITADYYEFYNYEFGIALKTVDVAAVAPTIEAYSYYSTIDEGSTEYLFLFPPSYPSSVFGTVTGYTVRWGDGGTSTGGDPTYQFLSHQYQTPGEYVIHVDLTDSQGTTFKNTESFPIDLDVLFVPPHLGLTPSTGTVYQTEDSYSLTMGSLLDAGTGANIAVQQYTINWGDGTNPTTFAPGDGLTQSHVYNQAGTFAPTVDVTVADPNHPGQTIVYTNVGDPVSIDVIATTPTLTVTDANGNTTGLSVDEGSPFQMLVGAPESYYVDVLGFDQYEVNWGDGTANNPDIDYYPVTVTQPIDHTYAHGTGTADQIFVGLYTSSFLGIVGFTYSLPQLGGVDVTVNNVPPTSTITSGPTGSVAEATSVTYSGTFTDPGANYDAAFQYQWSVTSNNPTVSIPDQTGTVATYAGPGTSVPNFAFTPPTYGSYSVSLVVWNSVNYPLNVPPPSPSIPPSKPATQALTVYDVAPTATLTTAPSTANEGDTLTYSATFTDPGTTYDQTYTYAWSVSSSYSISNPNASGNVVATYSATGTSVPDFTFTVGDNLPNNAPYTVSLVVTDNDGFASTIVSQSLTVYNVKPTVTFTAAPSTANEGDTLTYSATFTDPGTTFDDNYTYAWSVSPTYSVNNTSKTGTITTYSAAGTAVPNFTFTVGDNLPGNAPYTVSLIVTDKDHAPSTVASQTLTVYNVKPTVTLTAAPSAANEGDTLTYSATFTDPGTTFDDNYTYAWSVSPTYSVNNPSKTGTITTYSAAGTAVPNFTFTVGDNLPGNAPYTVSLIVTDKDNLPSTVASQTLTVANVKPTAVITSGPSGPINEGTYVTYIGTFTDPGTTFDDNYKYTWHVVSNPTQTISDQTGYVTAYNPAGTAVPSFTFLADDGPYTYTVYLTVTDKDLAPSTTVSKTLPVLNVAPIATFSSPPGIKIKNQPVAFNFASQFDPSRADTAAGFRYFFDFNNNGNFTDVNDFHISGTSPNSSDINGQSSPTAIFRFPKAGTFTVRARIEDKDGGYTDYTTTVTVIDTDLVLVGTGPGIQGEVKAYNAATGALKFDIIPFPGFTGGVNVAQADLNGDYYPDIIVGAGPGGGPNVKVYDGQTGAQIANFFAYAPNFTGGVYVAGTDGHFGGTPELITGAGVNGGPHIKVINAADLNEVAPNGQILDAAVTNQFFAYASTFTGGVRVATADVNGDGIDDLIFGAGVGGGPQVSVLNGTNFSPMYSFMAFDPTYTGGIYVTAGDVDGDGKADIIVSQSQGNLARVRVFSGADSHLMSDFVPYPVVANPVIPTPDPNGVTVLAIDRDGDGLADIVVGAGSLYPGHVRSFTGTTLQQISDIMPYDPGFLGGVFVG